MNNVRKPNKISVRKCITNEKEAYQSDRDKRHLIAIAILKGLYTAIGGEKGIPLSSNFEIIVTNAKALFTYMVLVDSKCYEKAEKFAFNNINFYISVDNVLTNVDVAKTLSYMIFSLCGYREDMVINHIDLETITVRYLNLLRGE